MPNFLEETTEAIKDSGHCEGDIVFIGSENSGHQCTWEEFQKLADFDHDSGHGATKVASDLVLVFADGHKLWRGERDGLEWWEYSRPFKRPETVLPIAKLQGGMWNSLAQTNKTRKCSKNIQSQIG